MTPQEILAKFEEQVNYLVDRGICPTREDAANVLFLTKELFSLLTDEELAKFRGSDN